MEEQNSVSPESPANDEAAEPEAKPAAVPAPEKVEAEPQAEAVTAPVEPYALAVPDFIPLKERTSERESYVSEFAALAPAAGLSASTAQGLLAMVVDAASALPYQGVDQHTTADDAFADMGRIFGEAAAENLTNRAQKYVARLGPKVADYLDRTGLGSDVGVVVSLALAGSGLLALTPKEARGETDRLMKTKEYMAGDKLTLLKLHALSRIANREPSAQQKAQATQSKMAADVGAAARAAVQAELSALAAKKSLTEEERSRWITLVAGLSK